ncbi:MAG TPA: hypothetical protein VEJ20_05635 [Candidatus Eremiobacteraceae bacterium]|nr:hypothetical protein [Candidatus Eremiobacteraceae bacterium]
MGIILAPPPAYYARIPLEGRSQVEGTACAGSPTEVGGGFPGGYVVYIGVVTDPAHLVVGWVYSTDHQTIYVQANEHMTEIDRLQAEIFEPFSGGVSYIHRYFVNPWKDLTVGPCPDDLVERRKTLAR